MAERVQGYQYSGFRSLGVASWENVSNIIMSTKIEPLRQRIINHVMAMKNGTDKYPPQPDIARESLMRFAEMLPELELIKGVKEAMK